MRQFMRFQGLREFVCAKVKGQRLLQSHLRCLSTAVGPFGVRGSFDITESLDKQQTQVRGYGETFFQINDVQVNQSVLLFRTSFLLWNARTFDDITVENLAPFVLLHPTLEVLFIGCGEVQPRQLPPDLVKFFRTKGVVLEASSTINAAATFNILSSEGRNVAAALLTNKDDNNRLI